MVVKVKVIKDQGITKREQKRKTHKHTNPGADTKKHTGKDKDTHREWLKSQHCKCDCVSVFRRRATNKWRGNDIKSHSRDLSPHIHRWKHRWKQKQRWGKNGKHQNTKQHTLWEYSNSSSAEFRRWTLSSLSGTLPPSPTSASWQLSARCSEAGAFIEKEKEERGEREREK